MGDAGSTSGRVSSGSVKPTVEHGRSEEVKKRFVPMSRREALPRRHARLDGYRARRNPGDQLRRMRRAIFRIGVKHKVAALARHGRRHHGTSRGLEKGEVVRVIREGRLVTLPKGTSLQKTEQSAKPQTTLPSQPATPPRKEGGEDLTAFEKVFMAHFEGEIPVGEELPPGQFKFLKKSEEAWSKFFKKFLPFVFVKKVKPQDVQRLIFRGLFQSKSSPQGKSTLTQVIISDLKLASGKTDRFARLSVTGQEWAQQLASLVPGETISSDQLARLLAALGEADLSYEALSHRIVNPELAKPGEDLLAKAYESPQQMKEKIFREGMRDDSKGIALSARTEQLMAERLEINPQRTRMLESGQARHEAVLAQKEPGFFSGLFSWKRQKGRRGAGDMTGEQSPVFVPWYPLLFRQKKYKGKVRWWVPFIYFVVFSAIGLATFSLVRYLVTR